MTESTFASMNPAYAFTEDTDVEDTEAEATDEDAGYDPGDHTVDEVLEHVEEHPDELEAVYAAEAEGKARVTLLEKLDSMSEDDAEE